MGPIIIGQLADVQQLYYYPIDVKVGKLSRLIEARFNWVPTIGRDPIRRPSRLAPYWVQRLGL